MVFHDHSYKFSTVASAYLGHHDRHATALAQGAPLPSRVEQIPVTIDGESILLQMRIYKPAGQGKFPTLVFNHGSTGFGMDSTRFKKSVDLPAVAAFFVQRC